MYYICCNANHQRLFDWNPAQARIADLFFCFAAFWAEACSCVPGMAGIGLHLWTLPRWLLPPSLSAFETMPLFCLWLHIIGEMCCLLLLRCFCWKPRGLSVWNSVPFLYFSSSLVIENLTLSGNCILTLFRVLISFSITSPNLDFVFMANLRRSALYLQASGTAIFHTRSHSLKMVLTNSKSKFPLGLMGGLSRAFSSREIDS